MRERHDSALYSGIVFLAIAVVFVAILLILVHVLLADHDDVACVLCAVLRNGILVAAGMLVSIILAVKRLVVILPPGRFCCIFHVFSPGRSPPAV